MSHRITIPCNPANPVNYLACCGLFDLLARMDSGALGWWQTTAPVAFLLESEIAETEFASTVLHTLCSKACWKFVCSAEGDTPVRLVAELTLPGKAAFAVSLDWWLETAEEDGTIRDKSAWKMYAGQQTVEGIIADMLTEAAKLRTGLRGGIPLAGLLDQSAEMTGRFGFDPRASRNALDVGYSPNDLHLPVRTFVFAELLATFGLHSFFPARTGPAGRLQSTRGWRGADDGEGEKGFAYCLWPEPLPIALARLAAAYPASTGARALFAPRAMRKNYSNLTLARTTPSIVTT
jgi:CRISPR-associated protein Csb3